jgi:predicted DNA-binding ribbon-helix-helix protein
MPKRVKDPRGKSQVLKRSVIVGAHKSSVSLEDAFWDGLKEIADAQGVPVSQLVAAIDSERRKRHHTNLSSEVRLFVLAYYRSRCSLDQPRPSGDPC